VVVDVVGDVVVEVVGDVVVEVVGDALLLGAVLVVVVPVCALV
jgi:hypothetical protein